jgi:hypothetical protein
MEPETTSVESADQKYYTDARELNKRIWESIYALKGMQARWNALDSGNTMGDGEGSNFGLVAADIGGVVFATTDAFLALLATGHATNMAKLL